MTASSTAAPTPATLMPNTTAEADFRVALNKDIQLRWSKISAEDVSALKSADELISKVSAKYGQDKTNAKFDVDALLKGRAF